MTDQLTARALATAAELLNAAAVGDRFAMRRILRDLREPGKRDQFSEILRAVSETHGIDMGLILSGNRRHEVIQARHDFCYIAVELFEHGYSATARALGGCDHTTVIHAVRRVSADPARRARAEEIAERLGWAGAA